MIWMRAAGAGRGVSLLACVIVFVSLFYLHLLYLRCVCICLCAQDFEQQGIVVLVLLAPDADVTICDNNYTFSIPF